MANTRAMTKANSATEVGSHQRRTRKVREDKLRNRDLLIETAKTVFAEQGAQASLEMIARRAGVGIGTLYRHFPARNALVEAVCLHEVQALSKAAERLSNSCTPDEALYRWMRLCIDYIDTKKVMADVVSSILGLPEKLYNSSAAQITDNPVFGVRTEIYQSSTALIIEAIEILTERAIAAGAIRGDAQPMDLIRAIAGFTVTYGDETEGWKASALRLVDILMDGLRMGKRRY